MAITEMLARAWRSLVGWTDDSREPGVDQLRAYYDAADRNYLNSGIYESLAELSHSGSEERKGLSALRSLRSPVHSLVEFYSAKLGAKDILERIQPADEVLDADRLTEAIKKLSRWSNLDGQIRVDVRNLATRADLFWKVATKRDREGKPSGVYRQNIHPANVTDFDTDERGYIVYLRLDVPQKDRDGSYVYTEVWDKASQSLSIYNRRKSVSDKLGEPDEVWLLSEAAIPSEEGSTTGFDFIPFVHVKFRDIGAERGLSSFAHAEADIREADRIATKLHDMLFPDVVWVLSRNQVGPDGESLPPPVIEGRGWATGYEHVNASQEARDGLVDVGGERMARLPGTSTLEPKIPDIKFEPHIQALENQVQTVEKKLPELAYYKLRELELSGVAMRTSLMDVTDRVAEAEQNFHAGLVRTHEMALTIGQVTGLEGFEPESIGTFEDGNFAHSIEPVELFPETREEAATTEKLEVEVMADHAELGTLSYYLEERGVEEEKRNEILAAVAAKEGGQRRSALQRLLNERETDQD